MFDVKQTSDLVQGLLVSKVLSQSKGCHDADAVPRYDDRGRSFEVVFATSFVTLSILYPTTKPQNGLEIS